MRACNIPIKINQNDKGYRYSLEPFLLAEFTAGIMGDKGIDRIIDLGTGSGAVAIMLASYFKTANIIGVELQKSLAETTKKNIIDNKLENRVKIVEADIRKMPLAIKKGTFDIVVSNPPYMKLGSGRLNPDPEKAVARHELKINLSTLLHTGNSLLKINGSLMLTYLPGRLDELLKKMLEVKIKPRYIKFVHYDLFSEASIVLVEGVKNGKHSLTCLPPIVLKD